MFLSTTLTSILSMIMLTLQYEIKIADDSFIENQLKDFFEAYFNKIINETKKDKITLIQIGHESNDLIEWYLQKDRFNYLIGNCNKESIYDFNGQNVSDYLVSPEIFVFTKLDRLQETLEKLKECPLWYPKSNVFFILYTPVDQIEYLRYCLPIIWSKHILNFILVYVYTKWNVVSYNKYEEEQILNFTDCFDEEDVFPNKLLDINGHEIRVGMFLDTPRNQKNFFGHWIGPDYNLLEMMTFMMNATLKIVESPASSHFVGLQENILSGAIDFSFIPYYQVTKFKGMEFSYPRKLEDLVVLVPKAGKIPQNQYLFLIFDYTIYVVVLILLILIACFLNYSHIVLTRRKTLFSYWLLQSWRGFLGTGGFPNFDRMEFVGKFLLTVWILVSIIISASFQCAFTSTLTKPKYFKEIDTLADLKSSGLDILCLEQFRDYVLKAERTDLNNQFIFIDWDKMLELRKGHFGKISFVEVASSAEILADKYDLHIVEEPIASGYTVYFFQKHSPFVNEIDRCALINEEMGLFEKHLETYGVPVNRKTESSSSHLTFEHLSSVFFILLFGYVLSFAVFFFEIINKRK